MDYPIQCPYCTTTIDSHDSLADSMAEYRDHLKRNHPDKALPE